MQATAERPARAGDANPFFRILADMLAGCAALFGFATPQARPIAAQAKAPAPGPVVEPVAPRPALAPVGSPVILAKAPAAPAARAPEPVEATAPPLAPAPETRTAPTALGLRVLACLEGKDPMRKTDIADLAGIGRGSANRIVERLVAEGWMRKAGEDTFARA